MKKYYIIYFYIIIVIKTTFISIAWEVSNNSSNDFFLDKESFVSMIVIFILAGLVETILFNSILYKFLNKFNLSKVNIVIIASLIFGIAHFSSIENMKSPVSSFISGIFYNLNYINYYKEERGNLIKAFLLTFFLHFMHNITIYIIDYYII